MEEMSFTQLYFSLDGRISRSTYWLRFWLPVWAISIVLILVSGGASRHNGATVALAIWFLLIIWPTIAVEVKRWHDRGKSGVWFFMHFVPLIGFWWVLVGSGGMRIPSRHRGTQRVRARSSQPGR
ncbi:MAG TPA: DUF805 domain-containing protein [Candidatus Kapabacteria bacterium]|nr:DUF805 domain-containing protein [Candidatus Kapabacteria bacterium]